MKKTFQSPHNKCIFWYKTLIFLILLLSSFSWIWRLKFRSFSSFGSLAANFFGTLRLILLGNNSEPVDIPLYYLSIDSPSCCRLFKNDGHNRRMWTQWSRWACRGAWDRRRKIYSPPRRKITENAWKTTENSFVILLMSNWANYCNFSPWDIASKTFKQNKTK